MLLQQIHDPYLSQYAYLIGCPESGEALIIDAQRDVAATLIWRRPKASESRLRRRPTSMLTFSVASASWSNEPTGWQAIFQKWAARIGNMHGRRITDRCICNPFFQQIQRIEITEIDAKADTVLDVRSTDEYAEAHLPGAVNLPHTRLVADAEQLPGKDEPLTVHCGSGARASLASAVLARMGHKVIFADGAFADWKQQEQQ